MGRVQDYLRRTYGFPVASQERQVLLGAVLPVEVAPNNPDRVGITLMNISVNNVYIGFDSAVAIANGLLLAANGGIIGFTAKDDGDLPTRQLWGISAAGAPTIYVVETEALE